MSQPDTHTERIDRTFAQIRAELPAVRNLLDAFQPVVLERSRLKALCAKTDLFQPEPLDRAAFQQGVPAASLTAFNVTPELIDLTAYRVISALEQGFPAIAPALHDISRALRDGSVDAKAVADALLDDRADDVVSLAQSFGEDPGVIVFVFLEILRPFVEHRAELIGRQIADLSWNKGYCPVCGSWPHLSIVRGKDGGRWLKCSLCSHEWRFMRTACPFCETQDQDCLSSFFSQDRPFERAEVCTFCNRYIVSADVRERAEEPATEALPFGLVYLDLLARDKGFEPGVYTEWNTFEIEADR